MADPLHSNEKVAEDVASSEDSEFDFIDYYERKAGTLVVDPE